MMVKLFFVGLLALAGCGLQEKGADADDSWHEGFLDLSGWQQVDRIGSPLHLSFMLNDADDRDEFNLDDPINDADTYTKLTTALFTTVRSTVASFSPAEDTGSSALSVDEAAAKFLPDLLDVDFSETINFPNGRGLSDDAANILLGYITNRGLQTGLGIDDEVANDSTYADEFPYLADLQE